MRNLQYTCDTKNLHTELRKVFEERKADKETKQFQKKKTPFYGLKFILFVIMSAANIKHYYIMGLLWYRTFLLDEVFAKKLIGKKRKNLLDIWAGSGSITEKFESFIGKIYCQEPSLSFQKILRKKGYEIVGENDVWIYEVVTLFNVIDVCQHPEKVIESIHKHTDKNSIIIITLPLPICARSWDNRNIRDTNPLSQSKELSFEEAASDFYINFLQKNHLQVTYFTRLPYMVSLPETQKVAIYDNALFVCKKI
jgi:DREV methyltransferase